MPSLEILWENIYKIWTEARGYELKEKEEDVAIKAIFVKKKEKAFVFVTEESVSVHDVRKIIEEAEEKECDKIMIATLDKVSTTALKEGKEHKIEFVHKGAPLIYIFDHYLVPQHRILSKQEAKEIINKYTNGRPELLPKILITDPAVRILGAKPGDIIEIIRRVPPKEELVKKFGKEFGEKAYELLRQLIPAGEEKYYRLVIEEIGDYPL